MRSTTSGQIIEKVPLLAVQACIGIGLRVERLSPNRGLPHSSLALSRAASTARRCASLASPGRFELPTLRLGGECSIHLSYGDARAEDWPSARPAQQGISASGSLRRTGGTRGRAR